MTSLEPLGNVDDVTTWFTLGVANATTTNAYDTDATTTTQNVTSLPPARRLSASDVGSVVTMLVLLVVIVVGNALVIAAVWRSYRLRTVTNYFIVQLAIADLMTGLVTPLHIAMFLKRELLLNIHICTLRYATVLVTTGASLLCLIAMTFDRYLKIIHPLRYQELMTRSVFIGISVAIWALGISANFILPMVWYNGWSFGGVRDCDFVLVMQLAYMRYLLVPFFGVYVILMVLMYSRVFNTARLQAAAIVATGGGDARAKREKLLADLRITKTCFIVMGIFFICWLPFFAVLSIQVYGEQLDNESLISARLAATFIAMSNSAMNPIVYAARLSTFSTEFRKILHMKPSMVDNF